MLKSNLPLWLCVAVPFLAAAWGFFVWMYPRGSRLCVIPKCVGSLVCVVSACLPLWLRGQSAAVNPVVWALLFCTLGDLLIEWKVVLGGLSFSVAHVLLIWWILGQGSVFWVSFFLWVFCVAVFFLLFLNDRPQIGNLILPMAGYILILTGDFALGAVLPVLQGGRFIPLAAGLACFVVSDAILGKNHFSGYSKGKHRTLMALYYAALFLISITWWLQ